MLRTIRLLKAVSMALSLCLAIGAATTVRAADLVETMRADGRFGNLVRAIEAAELADTLRGPGPFTVFAPTDEAFAARPEGELRDLLGGDPERLRTLLRHHVVEGRLPSNDLPPELPSLAGEPLAVAFGAGGLTVADGDQRATVVAGDIEADNGLIHAIDGVLVPSALTRPAPEVAAQPQQEEDAAAAAGPEVAVGQPGEEAGVEVATGQDGTRQVEARVTTESPPQPEPAVTVIPPPSEPTPPAPPAEAAEPGEAEQPQREQAQQPQPEEPEAQQQVVAPQPGPERQQPGPPPQQQQAAAPQPEQPEPQRQPRQEQQQDQQEQQPVQQARLTEEEPAPAEAREAPPTAVVSFENLTERTVRSSDGEVEGQVADLIFSRETGEIELVVVEYGGILGLGRKRVAVPWQGVRFDDEADQLIVDMSRAEMEEAPAFDYDALDTERHAQYRR